MNNELKDVLEAWKRLEPSDSRTKWAMLESLGYFAAADVAKANQGTQQQRKDPGDPPRERPHSRTRDTAKGEGELDEPSDETQPGQVSASETADTDQKSDESSKKAEGWLDAAAVEPRPTKAPPVQMSANMIHEPRPLQVPPLSHIQGEPLLVTSDKTMSPPELTPLFRSNLMRSIYMQLLAVRSPKGQIDVKELTLEVAQKKPMNYVPRLSVATMARGAQILIDRSDAMLPFRQDTRGLESVIGAVFGTDSIRVLHFVNNPMRRAGVGSRRRWRPYPEAWLPLERTRILVVTDLGIGYSRGEVPSAIAEWLDFAGCIARRDCPLTFLTPYGSDRWPPALTKRLKIIHWDPSTNAATVSRHT